MRRLAGLLSGVAVLAICAGPAFAQDGAGLYEPFPEAPGADVSRDFLKDLLPPGAALARDLGDERLERGVRLTGAELPAGAPLPAGSTGGPRKRAGAGGEPAALGWIAALALVAAALAAPALLRRAPA
jgi:hypothetical protein